jgi:heat shock protein HtpX
MADAYGLYTHIRSNRIRSVLLLGGLFLLIYVVVFAVALGFRGFTTNASLEWLIRRAWADLLMAWPFATVAALVWIGIAYKFHQSLIDAATGSHDVTRKEEPRLYNLLENLCISRGIPMPKLKIIETDALNAFATGLNEKQYSVTVTTGLLDRLDDAETEAVLAHELTHIRNGDVRLMVIAVIVSGIVGFLAELMFRAMFNTGGSGRPSTWHRHGSDSSSGSGWSWGRGGSSNSSDSKGSGGGLIAIIIAIVLIVLAWLLSQVIRFSLSRKREFLADAGAVELTKNPDAMITALRKIEGRGELPDSTSAVMEMCVDNPRSGFVDLFATHPSIDNRVDALVKFAGGHDPGPIAIPDYDQPTEEGEEQAEPADASDQSPADANQQGGDKTFLPGVPPIPIPIPGLGKPFLPKEPPLSPGGGGTQATPGPWDPPPAGGSRGSST